MSERSSRDANPKARLAARPTPRWAGRGYGAARRAPRLPRTAAFAAGAAIALSGCGVDKADEQSRQRDTIGDVQISTTFCTSGDVDQQSRACATYASPHRGQALVAYRIPVGSNAPATFADDGGRLHFASSDSYTAWLEQRYAEPGMHWAGYISDPQTVEAGTQAAFTLSPRLTLPTPGRPFAGPYRYYVLGGYRELTDAGDDGSVPVDCDGGIPATTCLGTSLPSTPDQASNDAQQPTRDLAVLRSYAPTVAAGEHADVPFDLRFAGAQGAAADFNLDASTDLAGARVTVSQPTLGPGADSDNPVAVDVAVPADAQPGTYTVTLTATAPADGGVIIHKLRARRSVRSRRARVAAAQGAQQRTGTMTFRVVAPPPADPPPPPPVTQPPPPSAPQPPARLRLSLQATPRRAYNGAFATYLLVAHNASNQAAVGTRVCAALPATVQFVRSTRRVRFRGRDVCFAQARLGGGDSAVALIDVRVDTDARAGMARAWATAAAVNAGPARARAALRVLRRAARPHRAPVTG